MNHEDRLDSWKDIANYVHRTIRTCYRWNKELEFPVHRIDKESPRSRVFAYKKEINRWFRKRVNKLLGL